MSGRGSKILALFFKFFTKDATTNSLELPGVVFQAPAQLLSDPESAEGYTAALHLEVSMPEF